MAFVLVVDDEPAMLQLVRRILEKDGHVSTLLSDATAVLNMNFSKFDLILLDVMMPGVDGFEICRQIRCRVDCPIIFLTAKMHENEIVQGLGIGADDYITKPFGMAEFRARVHAHLRRDAREKKNSFLISGVLFHLNAKEAEAGEVKLLFTKGEYEICEYLALHHGQTFTREQIYEAVFGFGGDGDSSVISSHIKNIRAKLAAYELSPIETVWGVGDKWV